MADVIPTPPYSNEEILAICKNSGDATKDFIFQQTMYRIKDPRKSIAFYTEVLGMKLLFKADFPKMKFSLYYLGYEKEEDMPGELGSMERAEWALGTKATLELTHNWGTEDDPDFKYHNGNSEPRGYGHIGVMVPDVAKACERFETLGVKFAKRMQDGTMKSIAFITDPDGYWIEIFNNTTL